MCNWSRFWLTSLHSPHAQRIVYYLVTVRPTAFCCSGRQSSKLFPVASSVASHVASEISSNQRFPLTSFHQPHAQRTVYYLLTVRAIASASVRVYNKLYTHSLVHGACEFGSLLSQRSLVSPHCRVANHNAALPHGCDYFVSIVPTTQLLLCAYVFTLCSRLTHSPPRRQPDNHLGIGCGLRPWQAVWPCVPHLPISTTTPLHKDAQVQWWCRLARWQHTRFPRSQRGSVATTARLGSWWMVVLWV